MLLQKESRTPGPFQGLSQPGEPDTLPGITEPFPGDFRITRHRLANTSTPIHPRLHGFFTRIYGRVIHPGRV